MSGVWSRVWASLGLGCSVGLRPAQNAQHCAFAGAGSRCSVLNFPKDGSRDSVPVCTFRSAELVLEHCGSCCFYCCEHQQGELDPAVGCDSFAALVGLDQVFIVNCYKNYRDIVTKIIETLFSAVFSATQWKSRELYTLLFYLGSVQGSCVYSHLPT